MIAHAYNFSIQERQDSFSYTVSSRPAEIPETPVSVKGSGDDDVYTVLFPRQLQNLQTSLRSDTTPRTAVFTTGRTNRNSQAGQM